MDPYLLTAVGWGSSLDPPLFAQAARIIHRTATRSTTSQLLSLCKDLLKSNQNEALVTYAINIFLHVVRYRWGELSDMDKYFWISDAPTFIRHSLTSTWELQNRIALLLSELIRKAGILIWTDLVNSTISNLTSCNQPCDEAVIKVELIQCLSRGITIPEDNLKATRSDTLKNQNWSGLARILFDLLEKHLQDPQQHMHLAVEIAHTLSAYAQWAQVRDLVEKDDIGINFIQRLQGVVSYQPVGHALFMFLSEICVRIQPTDCDDQTMREIFDFMMLISNTPRAQDLLIPGDTSERHERICKLMAALGLSSFGCISVDAKRTSDILKKMLECLKNHGANCHDQVLLFWEKVLYEAEKKSAWQHINDDIFVTCFNVAVERLVRVAGAVNCRERLPGLIKVIASQKPLIAGSNVMKGISLVYHNQENSDAISGAAVALQTVVNAMSCVHDSQPTSQAINQIKDLAKVILGSSWTGPKLVVINCCLLHCFDPYWSHFQEWIGPILDKLFEVLKSLPTTEDPAHVAFDARKRVRVSLISFKESVGLDFEPHKEHTTDMLDKMKGSSYITILEYDELMEKLCDAMTS